MRAKPKPRRTIVRSQRDSLFVELSQLVSAHTARCTQEAIELLERHGYLADSSALPTAFEAAQPFHLDTSCSAIPEDLKAVLAAAQRSDAPTLTETQARARVARNRLMLALKQRNMTQADLARLVKKSPAVVSRILQNPEKCRVSTLRRIADALAIELGDVFAPPQ